MKRDGQTEELRCEVRIEQHFGLGRTGGMEKVVRRMKSSSDSNPIGGALALSPCVSSRFLVARFQLLPACRIGPNCRRPDIATPAVFRDASGAARQQQASFADFTMVGHIAGQTLKGPIQIALANNQELAVTVARLEQAGQVAAEARSQYFLAIGYSRARTVCLPRGLGRNPGAIERKAKLLEETINLDVPAGLPSALLERRPGVLEAARRTCGLPTPRSAWQGRRSQGVETAGGGEFGKESPTQLRTDGGAFGGDPAPSSPGRGTVQFRWN